MSDAVAEAPPETASSEPTQSVDNDQSLLSEVMADMGVVPSDPSPPEESPKVQEPAAEATEDKGEYEATETENASPKAKLDAKTQASIDRRISKEVAKRKELEVELETERAYARELKEKAQGKSEQTSVPINPDDPYMGLSGGDLDAKDTEAKEFILWANKGPMEEGHEQELENGETKYWTPEEIKEQYNSYQEAILMKIPEARKKSDKATETLNRVAETYPELRDDKSKDFQRFAQVWNSPEIKAARSVDPENAAWLAAYVVSGMNAGVPKTAPNGSPPAAAPKVPMSSAPSGPPPMRTGSHGATQLSEADFQRAANGDLDSVVAKLLQS
jgi:hypothetical protein